MSIIDVKNLSFIRQIPVIGARIYEAFNSLQQGVSAMAVQANLNPTGQVDPPPAIQSVNAVGQNGVLHVSIEHTAAEVKRGVRYYVEHADNPNFTDAQIRQIGDSRSYSEFVGSQARFVRAYAAYPGSEGGPKLYHGGAATPQSVDAGGSIGPAAYLPSQGAGTGAPGQGGMGPGPVQVRTESSGFRWRDQRPVVSGGFGTGNSPGSQNGVGTNSGDSGGGSGGGVVTQPILVGTHANRLANYPSVKYPLYTLFWENDRTVEYWVLSAAGTVTVAGGVNVTWVSGDKFINTGTGFDASQWPVNTAIVIDGIIRRISVVNSDTSLTLASAAVNGIGLSYSVASGKWVYLSGTMVAQLAIPATTVPSDLGDNDAEFLMSATDYYHLYQWLGSAWTWGPGDGADGGDIRLSAGAKTPVLTSLVSVGAWKLLDGTGDDCTNAVSALNPVSFAGENTGLVYLTTFDDARNLYFKGQSAFSGAANAETVPTISGATDSATTGITVSGAGGASAGVGTAETAVITPTAVLTPPFISGGGGGAVTDPGHQHNLSSANAPIALPADPVRWMGAIPYLRR